jgi:hypothetical protein
MKVKFGPFLKENLIKPSNDVFIFLHRRFMRVFLLKVLLKQFCGYTKETCDQLIQIKLITLYCCKGNVFTTNESIFGPVTDIQKLNLNLLLINMKSNSGWSCYQGLRLYGFKSYRST